MENNTVGLSAKEIDEIRYGKYPSNEKSK